MPNPRRQDRELDALYATLPALDCQGLCHDSCGPIDMSVRERARIIERARKPVTCGPGATCSMLTADRRCGVYDIRPMICRLWGLTPKMRCPYGCVPERWLKDRECMVLIVEAERIGGSPMGDQKLRTALEAIASLTDQQAEASGVFAHSRATLQGRHGALAPTAASPLTAAVAVRRAKR